MDNFKKTKQKNQKKTLLTIIIGLAVIGIVFTIANLDISFESYNNNQQIGNVVSDFFETEQQVFVLEDCYVDLQGGKYIVGSNENDSSYFYGSYLIYENNDDYIIKCFYDTHDTATDIEFFDEYKMECGFEFELSADKKTLSAITDFSNFSFDELIF